MNDAPTPSPAGDVAWPDEIFRVLRDVDVVQVAYAPDSGHSALIERSAECDEVRAVPLASEEEGIALLAGAWLGGQRGALVMQSSGVGNCVNMLSLAKTCRFPLLLVVTMRGQWAETVRAAGDELGVDVGPLPAAGHESGG